MPLYNEMSYAQTYKFYELWENDPAWDGNTYASKYLAFNKAILDLSDGLIAIPAYPAVPADVTELLDLLYRKYGWSHIRYMDHLAFIVSFFRALHYAWPKYKQQLTLLADMQALTIADIQKDAKSIRNLINNPNDPTVTPDETPIPGLSTEQETMLNTSNELTAIMLKFDAMKKDILKPFYKELDPFFSVILSDDIHTVYPV